MDIFNKNISDIIADKNLNSKFLSIKHNTLDVSCKILKDNFYLDPYNYYPITSDFMTFRDVFSWGEQHKYNIFSSPKFLDNFKINEKNFKSFRDVYILGSSSIDNYYRNIITFLPRIFFIENKNIKLVVHRNLSNKFREFIIYMCKQLNIKIQFIFLDDGFYKFDNSKIPQFFDLGTSVKILNNLKSNKIKSKEKIYLIRQNTFYRNLVNEADIIEILKKNGFKIINLNNLNIFEQINLFSSAETIISAAGSSLANIVFCNPNTRIIEIAPKYNLNYENTFKYRYAKICKILNLTYDCITADPIEIKKIDPKVTKIIYPSVLKESNYYKNLIIKMDDLIKALAQ